MQTVMNKVAWLGLEEFTTQIGYIVTTIHFVENVRYDIKHKI